MRSLIAIAVFCCLVVLAAACGGKASSGSASQPAATTAPKAAVPASASGCGLSHPSGSSDQKLESGGLTRTYRLHVPKGYDAAKQYAMVLNFHGLGGNSRRSELYTGMAKKADAAGFVTVAPDGTGAPSAWHLLPSAEVDDFAFVRKLIDTVSAELCIDQARVYATGLSDGAFFTSVLACQLNDRLAAVAPIAGEPYYPPFCDGKAPIPFVAFHGTDDKLVPFETGIGTMFKIPIRGARESVKAWSQFNGCGADIASKRVAQDVVQESYTGCRNGADTQLYVIEGGGHTWPGGGVSTGDYGAQTRSINASDLIWSFFAAHSKK